MLLIYSVGLRLLWYIALFEYYLIMLLYIFRNKVIFDFYSALCFISPGNSVSPLNAGNNSPPKEVNSVS